MYYLCIIGVILVYYRCIIGVQVSAKALETAVFGAYYNVVINLKDISDLSFKTAVSTSCLTAVSTSCLTAVSTSCLAAGQSPALMVL